MKFSVSSSPFLDVLSDTLTVIDRNPQMAILSEFLMELNGNQLQVTASNLSSTVRASMEVSGEDDGAITIPARLLYDTVKSLPNSPITLETDENEPNNITVTSSYGEYHIAGTDPEEYPKIKDVSEGGHELTISSDALVDGINKTIFAASDDTMQESMQGVLFEFDYNQFRLVATDGHKMVRYTVSGQEGIQLNQEFVFLKKSLMNLKSIFPQGTEVKILFNRDLVSFSFDDREILSQLSNRKFPAYETAIPENNPYSLRIDRLTFLSSIRRLTHFSSANTSQIAMHLEGNSITLTARDVAYQNEAEEHLQGTYEGESMKIGFQARNLAELISVLESNEIELKMDGPTRAVVIIPVRDDDYSERVSEDTEILMLIMPIVLAMNS